MPNILCPGAEAIDMNIIYFQSFMNFTAIYYAVPVLVAISLSIILREADRETHEKRIGFQRMLPQFCWRHRRPHRAVVTDVLQ